LKLQHWQQQNTMMVCADDDITRVAVHRVT
jgi:hypothetical protein